VPARDVRVGDVITFQDPYVHGRLVTHRVIRIFHTSHGPAYRTKGDANATRDPWTIKLPDRVGRMSFSVPYAGYALWYAHTREVRTALIILAALFALSAMLRRIWRDEGAEAPA
jgi:signal peptidase